MESLFFSQHWACQFDYLQKMQKIVDSHFLSKSGLFRKEFSNSKANKPYVVSVSAAEGQARKNGQKKYVAVIPIQGAMFKRAGMIEQASGLKGTEDIIREIAAANADESISAIVLDAESPGGTVDGTQSVAEAIRNSAKPIVGFVNGLCASACYWALSQTKHVVMSEDTAMVGSIGTIYIHTDTSGWHDQKGIKVTPISSDVSTDKQSPSYYRPLSESDIQNIKDILNADNQVFIDAVKSARPQVADEAMTGKVYGYQKAKELGLVDSKGSLQDAVNQAVKLSSSNNSNSKQSKMTTESEASIVRDLMQAQIDEWKGKYGTLEIKAADYQAQIDKLTAEASKVKDLEAKVAEQESKIVELNKALDTTPADKAVEVKTKADGGAASKELDPYRNCIDDDDRKKVTERLKKEGKI